jgi:hypothetical protein
MNPMTGQLPEQGRARERAGWWIWAALSCDTLVVALFLFSLVLAEASSTDRAEEVAWLALAAVPVAACAAVALSVKALRSSRGTVSLGRRLVLVFLFVVTGAVGLFSAGFLYVMFTL